ncbi:hypothetical protein C453_12811 [Haloferax elongans ATCC BAA-1513]|uniref:SWIM-type domain-containing protein n=1 Tax=Haloferax elongans ATCC BAA-1513 TaxID=1230453 RepID=M0HL31_HALEO|nr:hypothetical protein [Haloferax elongans]ELZ84427.1 hypothetical protein C453_12811 [Haloferax elongans ATCC BAA-1513]
MSAPQTTTVPETHMDLSARDAKALTEPMKVVECDPGVWNDSEIAVYSEDRRYIVSLPAGYCECEDAHYRNSKCKHQRRVEFALGLRDIPSWANPNAIDDQLLRRLEEREDDE